MCVRLFPVTRSHFFITAHRPCIPTALNLKHLPLSHINFTSRASGTLCPALMHNSKLALFMTERVTDVQMFPSLICLRHAGLKWGAPVLMPVSETQRILKTHSQPFILCCWNNNVSRDPPPPPSPEHLREYVDFIYMTCHISAYEIEGCIT